jgi:hypothetical protein
MSDQLNKETNRTNAKQLNLTWASFFSFGVVAFFVWVLWLSRNFDFKTGLFPITAAVIVLVLACVQLLRDLLGKDCIDENAEQDEIDVPRDVAVRRSLIIFGWILVYFLGIWLFGFALGGALCSFVHLKFGAREPWPITLAMTFIAWATIYFFFDGLLHTPFPPGKIFDWLNLAGPVG